MNAMESLIERQLAPLSPTLSLTLPDGRSLGAPDAAVRLRLHTLAPLNHLASGFVGRLAEDYVEGRLDIEGRMRDVATLIAQLLREDPRSLGAASAPAHWLQAQWRRHRSQWRHRPKTDARQVQFHYDVSDDFYRLWLDPLRVYSCAYFSRPGMSLRQAQQAKLEHVCTKLMLKPGERFLDIGTGWGALLL